MGRVPGFAGPDVLADDRPGLPDRPGRPGRASEFLPPG